MFFFFFWQHHRLWSKGRHRSFDRSKQVTIESKKPPTCDPHTIHRQKVETGWKEKKDQTAFWPNFACFNGVPKTDSPRTAPNSSVCSLQSPVFLFLLGKRSDCDWKRSIFIMITLWRFSRSINVYDKWLCRGDNSLKIARQTGRIGRRRTAIERNLWTLGQNKISIDRTADRMGIAKSRSKSFEWECCR